MTGRDARAPERSSAGLGLVPAVAGGVSACGLAWLHGTPLLSLAALPALVGATAWTLVLLVVLVADLGALVVTGEGLGTRARRAGATVAWMARGDDRTTRGLCPSHRFMEGDFVDGPPARDARGRRILEVPGQSPLQVLVLGDSVMQRGFAPVLACSACRRETCRSRTP